MKGVELAAHLGVTKALVTRYKGRGMPMDSFEGAQQWMRDNIRPRVRTAAPHRAAPPPKAEAARPARPDAVEPAKAEPRNSDPDKNLAASVLPQSSPYLDARTSRERAEARIAQLRALGAEGLLVNRDRVRREVAQLLVGLRDGLLQIPSRLQSVIAAETDEGRCHDLLEDELLLVLQQFVEAV